jgi:hypothetical protein
MRSCVDAGLALARFSIIGYNRLQYLNWMQTDNFNAVRDNALAMQDYIAQTGADCTVASYHLILDQTQEQFEVDQYRKNFIDIVGSEAGIWKMHTWLRQMHAEQRFDEIPFCKDCDFLYDDHEVLVWSNSSDIQTNKLRGTNFKLDEYMP